MGSREQILNRDGNRRGLTYTCNCGWLDLGHMDPTSPQAFVGANDLWRQLRTESTSTRCSHTITAVGGGMAHSSFQYLPTDSDGTCHEPGLIESALSGVSQAHFGPGFVVNYTQQVPGRAAYHGRYLVKSGLTLDVKKRVALTILLQVSHGFESLQRGADWIGIASGSGYAADDLTANVIGSPDCHGRSHPGAGSCAMP